MLYLSMQYDHRLLLNPFMQKYMKNYGNNFFSSNLKNMRNDNYHEISGDWNRRGIYVIEAEITVLLLFNYIVLGYCNCQYCQNNIWFCFYSYSRAFHFVLRAIQLLFGNNFMVTPFSYSSQNIRPPSYTTSMTTSLNKIRNFRLSTTWVISLQNGLKCQGV